MSILLHYWILFKVLYVGILFFSLSSVRFLLLGMASEDYLSAIQKLMVEDITLVFVTLEIGVQLLNTAKISVTVIHSFKLMGRNSNIAQRHAFWKLKYLTPDSLFQFGMLIPEGVRDLSELTTLSDHLFTQQIRTCRLTFANPQVSLQWFVTMLQLTTSLYRYAKNVLICTVENRRFDQCVVDWSNQCKSCLP